VAKQLTKPALNIERTLPLRELNQLAEQESHNKHFYRPSTYTHKWWARRLGSVFRTIVLATFLPPGEPVWERYYERHDFSDKVVLDPFMGGGTTIVEALRLGCKVVGCDVNPVAWWTVKRAVESTPMRALNDAFRQLEADVAPRIRRLYRTRCPHPGCDREADILNVLWVNEATCVGCGATVPLHGSYVVDSDRDFRTLLCPKCGAVFTTQEKQGDVACPACAHAFDPRHGPAGAANFTCPACSQTQPILKAAQREPGPFLRRMYAVLCSCPVHARELKAPDADDRAVFRDAVDQFERERDTLLIPRAAIPDGNKSRDLLNYNYTHWHMLFNERQLLALAWLLQGIARLPDPRAREALLGLFSYCLDYNTIFATYNGRSGGVRGLFTYHAFVVPTELLENNVWGAGQNSGSFAGVFARKMKQAQAFREAPSERRVLADGGTRQAPIVGERIDARFAASFEELARDREKNALLLCRSSEDLPIPSGSVDAVITDPPYFNNVQYSELSDFFYVWLRLALKDTYPHFASEYTPKISEIVENPNQGKDTQFFLEGLARVFEECRRVLKDDGALIFSFHHREPEAWGAVLGAVLDAGFYVSAIYPVQAERDFSLHIRDQEAIEYDALIICRKRAGAGRISWEQLEDQIHFQAAETLRGLQTIGQGLSRADITVIVLGKCLELYSQHYPDVLEGEQPVAVEAALNRLWGIIDSLATEEVMSRLPVTLDEVTRAYASTLASRGEMEFNEFNMTLRHRGLSTAVFSDEALIAISGKMVRVLEPEQRRGHIEAKLEREQPLLDIDRAHYLYAEYRYGAHFRAFRQRWRSPELDELCRYLAEVTGDGIYDKIVEAEF
jgi:adenine-specific DNA methylase